MACIYIETVVDAFLLDEQNANKIIFENNDRYCDS